LEERANLAMDQAVVQEERNAAKPPRTPKTPKMEKENMPVVGETSGSTWGSRGLDRFKVTVKWDVDALERIPKEYFEFSNIKHYNRCKTFIVPR
jgi:hypothetical protein